MAFYSPDFQPELLNKYGCSAQEIFTLITEVMLHRWYNRFTTFLHYPWELLSLLFTGGTFLSDIMKKCHCSAFRTDQHCHSAFRGL